MQAPPAMNVGNFACSSCGGEIPRTIPKGMVFPCPYCQHSLESPGSDVTAAAAQEYQAWALQHGAAAASIADNAYRREVDPDNAVFASASTQLGFVRNGRVWLLGSAVREDGSWVLRMVDASTRQVVWEALDGMRWAQPPDEQQLAVRSDRLFVALEGVLHCVDLSSGRRLWGAMTDSNLETHPDLAFQGDELMLYDFPLPSAEGAVVAMSKSGTVAAWGRDSGRVLWTQAWDRPAVHHVPGLGVIVDDRSRMSFVRAFDGSVVAHWTGDDLPGEVCVQGDRILLRADVETQAADENRVRVLDASTLELVCEQPVDSVSFDPAPVLCGTRIFTAIDDVAGSTFHILDPAKPPKKPFFLFAMMGWARAGTQHQQLPIPKQRLEAIVAVGSLVLFDLRPLDGGESRRIIGIDRDSAAVRFDSGPLSGEPSTMSTMQIQHDDDVFVYVTAPSGDDAHCELRAVDANSGQQLWSQDIGDWSMHSVQEGHVVLVHHPQEDRGRTIATLQLRSGALVTRFPFDPR